MHQFLKKIRVDQFVRYIPPVTRMTFPVKSGISVSALNLLEPNIMFRGTEINYGGDDLSWFGGTVGGLLCRGTTAMQFLHESEP
jgi:hypothetical protein